MSGYRPDAASRIVRTADLDFQPFSLPGFSGGTYAAFPNTDTGTAPFVALLKMDPGAVLARHYHPNAVEGLYVVEGEMINEGEPLGPGAFIFHGPGVPHGPHETRTSCTLMFLQYPGIGPDDSVFV